MAVPCQTPSSFSSARRYAFARVSHGMRQWPNDSGGPEPFVPVGRLPSRAVPTLLSSSAAGAGAIARRGLCVTWPCLRHTVAEGS